MDSVAIDASLREPLRPVGDIRLDLKTGHHRAAFLPHRTHQIRSKPIDPNRRHRLECFGVRRRLISPIGIDNHLGHSPTAQPLCKQMLLQRVHHPSFRAVFHRHAELLRPKNKRIRVNYNPFGESVGHWDAAAHLSVDIYVCG
jgi:hypothetical protein